MSLVMFITVNAGISLFVILFVLYIFLLVRKVQDRRYLRIKRLWLDKVEDEHSALTVYMSEGIWSRSIVPYKFLHYEALEELFSHRLKIGTTIERQRIYDFTNRFFVDMYRRRLERSRWSERMNTLLYIEMFHIKAMLPDLLRFLDHKNCSEQEKLTIYRLLGVFQHEGIHGFLVKGDLNLPSYVYRQMLYPLPYSYLQRYVADFEQCPAVIRDHVLDVLRVRHERTEELLILLQRLLDSEERELRIRALKGLASFGYMTDEALQGLHQNMGTWHQRDWPERLMLARLMGSIRDKYFLPHLETLMGDQAYLVRVEAAKSISYYQNGLERLSWIAHSHADRYAREMATERLEQT
jgi:hypothetical protein